MSPEYDIQLRESLEAFFGVPYFKLAKLDLVREGLVDSMKVVELILIFEEKIGHELEPELIDSINWRSSDDIVSLLIREMYKP